MIKQKLAHFLDWSSLIFHLDTKYFTKASILNGIQQTVGVLCGLTISYFFGHFASKQLFGDYNLILSILGFLTIITLPGIDGYLIRSLSQKYDSSYLRSVKIKFFLSLIGLPILFSFSFYYLTKNQESLGIALLIASFLFPFFHPLQLFNEFFIAKMNFKILTIILSSSSILTTLLIVFSIIYFQSLPVIIFLYFLGILIPSFFGFFYSLRFIKNIKKEDPDLISYGLFITLLSVLPWSSGYLGQIILGTTLNTELLAIFVVANKIPIYIQKNLFVFYKPITAKLAQQSNKLHLITLKKHSLKLVLWGVLLALPIYLFSPFVIKFIFTDKYMQAIPFARILSLSVIPLPLTWVIGDILVFQKIRKPRLYATLILNTIKIILYLLVIPVFKLAGLVVIFTADRYITPLVEIILIVNNNRRRGKPQAV